MTTIVVNQRTKEKELVANYAFDEDTLKQFTVPAEHPSKLGATYDTELCEWVIEE